MNERWKYWSIGDSPGWGERHKLGPVHFILTCRQCGFVIDDIHPDALDHAEEKMGDHCIEDIQKEYEKLMNELLIILSKINTDGDGI